MRFQAIVTKYLPPTNHKPSRIKATAEAGSVTLSWDYGLNQAQNHAAAAKALAELKGWAGHYFQGSMPGGKGDVFVSHEITQEGFWPHPAFTIRPGA